MSAGNGRSSKGLGRGNQPPLSTTWARFGISQKGSPEQCRFFFFLFSSSLQKLGSVFLLYGSPHPKLGLVCFAYGSPTVSKKRRAVSKRPRLYVRKKHPICLPTKFAPKNLANVARVSCGFSMLCFLVKETFDISGWGLVFCLPCSTSRLVPQNLLSPGKMVLLRPKEAWPISVACIFPLPPFISFKMDKKFKVLPFRKAKRIWGLRQRSRKSSPSQCKIPSQIPRKISQRFSGEQARQRFRP